MPKLIWFSLALRMGWPVEFGGPGWNPVQQYIFEEESALAGAPRLLPFGTKMVAPVIMAFGTAAQQQRYLPNISSGAEWWCQGYSEPGAGSDLASLKTRAVRDGDHYIVDGQKTWNTLGQYADWIFCLTRTDSKAKQQSGITFLLIDMKSPGITVHPIMLLDGGQEVNEIWFENVRVPVENRVGEENRGWTYAKFLLGHERTSIAGVGVAKRELKEGGDEVVTLTIPSLNDAAKQGKGEPMQVTVDKGGPRRAGGLVALGVGVAILVGAGVSLGIRQSALSAIKVPCPHLRNCSPSL